MDGDRFDALTRAFGAGRSRLALLKAGLGAVLGLAGIGEAEAATRLRSVGNSCTLNSDCASNLCVAEGGTRKICHCAFPADCPAAKDVCHSGACLATGYCGVTINVGTACDDGNRYTTGDVCQADGSCKGTPVVCAASDQCHLAGACDPATGVCSNPNKPNGTPCNDGNACTQTDTCQAGVCTGGNPVVCAPLDQCHVAGTCDPATGQCSNPAKVDGSACNDGNACTTGETCQAGVCQGGTPVVCTASDQCHVAGTCDPATGICTNPAKLNGTACNDGNACTQSDACQAGVCVGSNPVVCTASDPCHAAGVCDTTTGLCTNPARRTARAAATATPAPRPTPASKASAPGPIPSSAPRPISATRAAAATPPPGSATTNRCPTARPATTAISAPRPLSVRAASAPGAIRCSALRRATSATMSEPATRRPVSAPIRRSRTDQPAPTAISARGRTRARAEPASGAIRSSAPRPTSAMTRGRATPVRASAPTRPSRMGPSATTATPPPATTSARAGSAPADHAGWSVRPR
jgi:hypothetical protein